jgi:hypothetical protein
MPKRSNDERPALKVPPGKRLSQSSSPASVERRELELTASSSATDVAANQARVRTGLEQHTAAPAGGSILQRADSIASSSLDSDPSTVHMGIAGSTCFRITNVPQEWNRKKLLDALMEVDPVLQHLNFQISLYPCVDSSQTQTALLNLETCTEYFVKSDHSNYLTMSNGTLLVFDSHFYDLTPLNSPEGEIVAE